MQDGLEAYCARRFPEKQQLQVNDFRSVTGGWENEVYAFDLEYGPPEDRRTDPLILRVYPGDYADLKSHREFHAMRKLHTAGYPVPYVHILESSDSPFGKPFLIMERVEGQLMRARMSALAEADRGELRTQFCRLLVQLHNLDWRPFQEKGTSYEAQGPYAFVDKYLTGEREVVEEWHLPGFLPTLTWLEKRRGEVPCIKPAVIHGDFHAGNLLIRHDGSVVVLDWTGCQVGDPRLDLARTLLFIRAYGSEERRKHYVAEYERLAGEQMQQLEWFEALACLLRLRDVVIALSKGPAKLGWRPDVGSTVRQHMAGNRQTYEFLLNAQELGCQRSRPCLHPAMKTGRARIRRARRPPLFTAGQSHRLADEKRAAGRRTISKSELSGAGS